MSQGWQQFIQLFDRINNDQERSRLLEVLMSAEERSAIVHRMQILQTLLEGQESQRELAARLNVSIATVTRGSNNLKQLHDDDRVLLSNLLTSHQLDHNE